MNITEILGYIASTVTTLSAMPQLYKIIKSKSAKDVSIPMFVILATGNVLWFSYGLMLKAAPIYVSNTILFIISSVIIIYSVKYSRVEDKVKAVN